MISYDVAEFGAPLRRAERPTPMPQGSEVLMRTLAAGVCHSDLHIWEGGYDLGQGRRMNVADRGIRPPLTMGHEIAGEVVALGSDAEGVAVGEKFSSSRGSAAASARSAAAATSSFAPSRARSASFCRAAMPTTSWCRIRAT